MKIFKKLYTTKEAGEYMGGLSAWLVCSMIRKGELPFVLIGRQKMLDVKDLEKWINVKKSKTKVCSKCKTEKELNEFHRHYRGLDGHAIWCKNCVSNHRKGYYLKNAETIKQRRRNYVHSNGEEVSRKKRESGRKLCAELSDSYVKHEIRDRTGLSRDEITPEMIILKREQLFLTRTIKEATDGLNRTGSERN
jgi:excisionase family DNA binding protein